jgi:hypothetical protein
MSIVAFITKKRNRKTRNPEQQATETLHNLFYGGAGAKFLGWQRADKLLLDDGTWKKLGKDGWRFWTIPTEEDQRRWWNPVWDHLKGNNRGIVAINATHVPFLSVDQDRHDGSVLADAHVLRVLKANRLLKKQFPELYWPVAEVNNGNGSAKSFGFTGKLIPIEVAVELGRRVHDFLLENGLGDLEVFPFNCVEVGLPMRTDKTTIVFAGVLNKVWRKKKVDGKMISFETYSAAAFLDAIRSHSYFDESTLHHVLKIACENLPDRPVSSVVDVPVKAEQPVSETKGATKTETGMMPKALGSYGDEPNALTRQLRALLELARRLHRVPSEEEVLSFLKENRLYSGDWSENEGRRQSRVRWILGHITKTFDPAKCGSAKYKVEFGKYDNWARTHVGILREKVRRYVDEYGEIHEQRGRSIVEWRFVSVMLSILESCFANQYPDKSLPEKGARRLWESSYDAGVIDIRWNEHKWAIARDWLHKLGVIDVFDRKWRYCNGSGQAMKWRPTDKFYGLHVWYKTKRQPSLNDPVPLQEFLLGMHTPTPLNYYLDTEPLVARFSIEKLRSRPPP